MGYEVHQLALHLGQAEPLGVAYPGAWTLVPAQGGPVGDQDGTQREGAVPELLILGSPLVEGFVETARSREEVD